MAVVNAFLSKYINFYKEKGWFSLILKVRAKFMHKICAREVKTTGMETVGNQWGGTNFRKRFINFKKMLAISKKYGIIMIVSFRK